MDAYSAALLTGLIAGFGALAAALLARLRRARVRPSLVLGSALVGGALALAAAVGHRVCDHRAGTEAALTAGQFAVAHPAPLAALAAAGLAIWLVRGGGPPGR